MTTNTSEGGFGLVDDLRIVDMREIAKPEVLLAELPNSHANFVLAARHGVHRIITNADERMLVVVGPCSIHDQEAAFQYARQLKELADELADNLFIVMRVYFEKPRTTVGWKGLINDPGLDGSYRVNDGLRLARRILLEINGLGMPCGTELLDVFIPQYLVDLVTWGAIGARTTESQVHREMASGLSCPIGFKNGTEGNVRIAVDAVRAARQPHRFLSIAKNGRCSIAETSGNEDTHVILRGGTTGPNYSSEAIEATAVELAHSGLAARIMVDCSHANSGKDYRCQPQVCDAICAQLAAGDNRIFGLMAESNLSEGRQDIKPSEELQFGVSITDSCIGWETTEQMLRRLASACASRQRKMDELNR